MTNHRNMRGNGCLFILEKVAPQKICEFIEIIKDEAPASAGITAQINEIITPQNSILC